MLRNLYKLVGVFCCLIGGILGNTYHSYGSSMNTNIRAADEEHGKTIINFTITKEEVNTINDDFGIESETIVVKEDEKGLVLEYTFQGEATEIYPSIGIQKLLEELENNQKYLNQIYKLVVKRAEDDRTSKIRELSELEESFTLPANISSAEYLFKDTIITELPMGFKVLTREKPIGYLFWPSPENIVYDPTYDIADKIDYGVSSHCSSFKIKLPSVVDSSFVKYVEENYEETPNKVYFYQELGWVDTNNKIVGLAEDKELKVRWKATKQLQHIWHVTGQPYDNRSVVRTELLRAIQVLEKYGYVDVCCKVVDNSNVNVNPITQFVNTSGLLTHENSGIIPEDALQGNDFRELWEKVESALFTPEWTPKTIYIYYRERKVEITPQIENNIGMKDNWLNLDWLKNNVDHKLHIQTQLENKGSRITFLSSIIRKIKRESNLSWNGVIEKDYLNYPKQLYDDYDFTLPYPYADMRRYEMVLSDEIDIDPNFASGKEYSISYIGYEARRTNHEFDEGYEVKKLIFQFILILNHQQDLS